MDTKQALESAKRYFLDRARGEALDGKENALAELFGAYMDRGRLMQRLLTETEAQHGEIRSLRSVVDSQRDRILQLTNGQPATPGPAQHPHPCGLVPVPGTLMINDKPVEVALGGAQHPQPGPGVYNEGMVPRFDPKFDPPPESTPLKDFKRHRYELGDGPVGSEGEVRVTVPSPEELKARGWIERIDHKGEPYMERPDDGVPELVPTR